VKGGGHHGGGAHAAQGSRQDGRSGEGGDDRGEHRGGAVPGGLGHDGEGAARLQRPLHSLQPPAGKEREGVAVRISAGCLVVALREFADTHMGHAAANLLWESTRVLYLCCYSLALDM
jgi:hypothetical protein